MSNDKPQTNKAQLQVLFGVNSPDTRLPYAHKKYTCDIFLKTKYDNRRALYTR